MLSSRLVPFPGRWLAVPPGKDVSVRGQGEGETDRYPAWGGSSFTSCHTGNLRAGNREYLGPWGPTMPESEEWVGEVGWTLRVTANN